MVNLDTSAQKLADSYTVLTNHRAGRDTIPPITDPDALHHSNSRRILIITNQSARFKNQFPGPSQCSPLAPKKPLWSTSRACALEEGPGLWAGCTRNPALTFRGTDNEIPIIKYHPCPTVKADVDVGGALRNCDLGRETQDALCSGEETLLFSQQLKE